MPSIRKQAMATVALVIVGGLGLGGCASTGYVDQQIATVNSRIDGLESRVQQAESTAQAAAGSAQQANQRIDQLSGRVDSIEQRLAQGPAKRPRN